MNSIAGSVRRIRVEAIDERIRNLQLVVDEACRYRVGVGCEIRRKGQSPPPFLRQPIETTTE